MEACAGAQVGCQIQDLQPRSRRHSMLSEFVDMLARLAARGRNGCEADIADAHRRHSSRRSRARLRDRCRGSRPTAQRHRHYQRLMGLLSPRLRVVCLTCRVWLSFRDRPTDIPTREPSWVLDALGSGSDAGLQLCERLYASSRARAPNASRDWCFHRHRRSPRCVRGRIESFPGRCASRSSGRLPRGPGARGPRTAGTGLRCRERRTPDRFRRRRGTLHGACFTRRCRAGLAVNAASVNGRGPLHLNWG
jgi:hypothetical protein